MISEQTSVRDTYKKTRQQNNTRRTDDTEGSNSQREHEYDGLDFDMTSQTGGEYEIPIPDFVMKAGWKHSTSQPDMREQMLVWENGHKMNTI